MQTLQKYYSNSVGNPLLYPSSLHSQNLFFCIRVPPQKIVHPLDPQSLQIRNRLIRDSGAPRFIFVVYWLELLVSVWLVFIVMVLVVACLFGFVSSPIVTVSQIHFIFLFLCIFDDGKTSFMSSRLSLRTWLTKLTSPRHEPRLPLRGINIYRTTTLRVITSISRCYMFAE